MKIVFPIAVYQKLRAYVESVKVEISGLGRVSIQGQSITIEEVRIFKQICSAGGTVLDKRDIAQFWDTLDDPSDWKLWWHSHGELDAYFSPTDHATIAEFDNQTKEDNWQLSLVTNRAEKIESRVDFFWPFQHTIKNLDWEIDFISRDLEDEVFEEVSQKVEIYQEKRKIKEKNKRSTTWEEDTPLLPARSSANFKFPTNTILDDRGNLIEIDPDDIRRHPELFNLKGGK